MSAELDKKAASAAKWSLVTETLAKLISPLTQLILARILTPEAFGMVATVTMVTSFADTLSDSGFQKYLVQHEFRSRDELYRNANVAFWTNLGVSLLLWAFIAFFRDPIAAAAGNAGLGFALAVACASLPMTSFTSIQLGLYRREFQFKRLLPSRVVYALTPLAVTVPLALMGLEHWALIIGTLASQLVYAVMLTAMSEWKPQPYFSFALLREMFSFCGWSLLEAIAVWFTTWAGTFVVGNVLSSHYLGLYKQPMTFVNSIFSIITSSTTPVLFSSLARLQGDREGFHAFYFRFQYTVGMFVLPLGAGLFFFREFAVDVLMGEQWTEAALMFGLWGLSTGFMTVFSHYCSEVYRALGKPRVSMVGQCLYMAVMVPALYWAAMQGFNVLVVISSAVRVVGIAINQVLCWRISGISFAGVARNLRTPLVGTALMCPIAYGCAVLAGASWPLSVLGILVCMVAYALVCCLFQDGREFVVGFLLGEARKILGRLRRG